MKKFLLFTFLIFFLFFWIVGSFQSCIGDVSYDTQDDPTDSDSYDSAETIHTVSRKWLDYYNNTEYRTHYSMLEEWHSNAYNARENFNVANWQSDDDFWQQVYVFLYEQNRNELTFLEDSLKHIGDSLQLNKEDFARMVVSFVQDIPYNYILSDSCDAKHTDFPCVPFVKYGILSPIEFLCTLQGDCDTRTVLIFTLLKNFGYEPVIVNSNEYLHSMIALDIPSTGDYLDYNGKRYAFWETTNVGWLPGMLPPEMNNTKYWHVILHL